MQTVRYGKHATSRVSQHHEHYTKWNVFHKTKIHWASVCLCGFSVKPSWELLKRILSKNMSPLSHEVTCCELDVGRTFYVYVEFEPFFWTLEVLNDCFKDIQDKFPGENIRLIHKRSSVDQIFLGGLHPLLTESDLFKIFSPFGDLLNVEVKRRKSGKSRCFGFATYLNSHEKIQELVKQRYIYFADDKIEVKSIQEKKKKKSEVVQNNVHVIQAPFQMQRQQQPIVIQTDAQHQQQPIVIQTDAQQPMVYPNQQQTYIQMPDGSLQLAPQNQMQIQYAPNVIGYNPQNQYVMPSPGYVVNNLNQSQGHLQEEFRSNYVGNGYETYEPVSHPISTEPGSASDFGFQSLLGEHTMLDQDSPITMEKILRLNKEVSALDRTISRLGAGQF